MKKVTRTIKYFKDGEKIPENAVYLHSLIADFNSPKEQEYRREVRHYFIIHK